MAAADVKRRVLEYLNSVEYLNSDKTADEMCRAVFHSLNIALPGLSGYVPNPVISSSSKPLAMPGPREPETPSVPCTCGQKREWPGPHHLTTCKMWEAGK